MTTNDNIRKKRVVMMTGATGVMGFETLKELTKHDEFKLRLLVRRSKRNEKLLRPFLINPDVTIVWGDMMNREDVAKALGDADIVLHIGGMVSPKADRFPDKTLEVNTRSAQNIVEAIKNRKSGEEAALVYIGSVAQTSDR
ncbi:MAG: NAD-dependent epimerase/dehydratase family protein, partial [Muribaculaceae bacterium]|nr:NAD-dependent epimerase/dehydratase family protein [Muribaculaceae bacterium]